MFKVIVKIASQSGQRWRGIFERLARKRLGMKIDSGSGSVKVTTAIHDGFLAKFTRKGNNLSVDVIDITGIHIGFTSSSEKEFSSPFLKCYYYNAGNRDIFNPKLDINSLKKDINRSFYKGKELLTSKTLFVSGSNIDFHQFWFYASVPYEGNGICGGSCNSNYQDIYEKRKISVSDNFYIYDCIREDIKFLIDVKFIPSLDSGLNIINVIIDEEYINRIANGYFMYRIISPRSQAISHMLPSFSSAIDGGRMAIVIPLTTNPRQVENNDGKSFPDICGTIGLMIFVAINSKSTIKYKSHFISLDDMNLDGIKTEEWSSNTPWIQDYFYVNNDHPATNGNKRIFYFPVLTEIMKETLSGNLSSQFGTPTLCFLNDSIEILIDLRLARTWVDTRGKDISNELRPVTIQTQTAIIKLTVSDFSEENGKLGEINASLVSKDVSGYKENGCFLSLGGSNQNYHSLWRTVWSGNSGGKHVALISVVKHDRYEYIDNGFLHTSQSSFFGDATTRLYSDPLAIQLYVNGNIVEHSCKDIGFSFRLDSDNISNLLRDDYYSIFSVYQKCATVAGDDLVFFCAYSYPVASHVILIRWDINSCSMTEIRRDKLVINGRGVLPAISCYQRQVINTDKEISPACLIYRIGVQDGPGYVYLSKDSGVTWSLLWGGDNSYTPGMGVYYIGSQIWRPEYGYMFKRYL